jgi:hypothetical protein
MTRKARKNHFIQAFAGVMLPAEEAGIFGLPAVSCLTISSTESYRRSKNNHLSWPPLPFLGMYVQQIHTV